MIILKLEILVQSTSRMSAICCGWLITYFLDNRILIDKLIGILFIIFLNMWGNFNKLQK